MAGHSTRLGKILINSEVIGDVKEAEEGHHLFSLSVSMAVNCLNCEGEESPGDHRRRQYS